MPDFHSTIAAFQDSLQQMKSRRGTKRRGGILQDWLHALAPESVTALNLAFDPRDIDDYFGEDELVFRKRLFFFDKESLKQHCAAGPDCLAGDNCIPVGGVTDSEELLFVTSCLNVAILHHDEVFAAEDLDAIVDAHASDLPPFTATGF